MMRVRLIFLVSLCMLSFAVWARPEGTPQSVSTGEQATISQSPPIEPEREDTGGMAAWLREHLQASLVVEYATFLIAVVTIIFAIFLGAFGYVERERFKKLEEEIAKKKQALDDRVESFKKDLEDQRRELTEEGQTLDARVETFKSDLDRQEQRLVRQEQRLVDYQRFLDAVLAHHSELLLGIIEGFSSALRPEEGSRLRSLISEAEAALNLFLPDRREVPKALMKLEQIGAENAVPSLVRLKDDERTPSEIRVEAQRVLSKIQERLREARKATIEQQPDRP